MVVSADKTTEPPQEGVFSGANSRLLAKLLVVTLCMFAFGFILVPIYRKVCDVTGLNNLVKPEAVSSEDTQNQTPALVRVEFDANMPTGSGWVLTPETPVKNALTGRLVTVYYRLKNLRSTPLVGQAIPSYLPQGSARYFRKIECFCFRQQVFEPHEERRLPVVFSLDPKLPADLKTLTLSYTFFEIPQPEVKDASKPPQ